MRTAKFSLSNTKLATFDMGELVPIGLMEVLPGDTIQQATSALVRVSPLNSPVMHPVHVKIHHWFVPHRLVWDDFENFITGGADGLNASVFPTITVNSGSGWAVGSLADYMGVPTGVDDLPISALPFRGYALIWNNFYRDQRLQTALTVDTTDGADTTTNTTLQNSCWEKDYYTTARSSTQLGAEVTMPLAGTASVTRKTNAAAANLYRSGANTNATNGANLVVATNGGNQAMWDGTGYVTVDNAAGLEVNLASATGPSINDLREAFALQRYKEARLRYGARYTEYLRYLGIRSSDQRLQLPEYLGGGKETINFSEVLQTAPSTSGTPGTGVGLLRGHGIGAMRSNRYRRFFEEHGYVFSFMVVKPKTMYADGLQKHWSYATKEDFFQKELQFIGQQEILNKELRWSHATPNGVFGYQDRYDQYRRTESSIAGLFRESSMNVWHYARLFSSDPALNATFVSCVPTKRVNQDTSSDCLWVMANHSIQARRMVAKVGTPSDL